jgi:hypothetical protein
MVAKKKPAAKRGRKEDRLVIEDIGDALRRVMAAPPAKRPKRPPKKAAKG